jgi:vacuolar protein sorting-associated protein IST1
MLSRLYNYIGSYFYRTSPPDEPKPQPISSETIKLTIMKTDILLKKEKDKRINNLPKLVREILNRLKEENIDKAKFLVDKLIKEEQLISVLEVLTVSIKIIFDNHADLAKSETCPEHLCAQVNTLIYASAKLENREILLELRELFNRKYGQLIFQKAEINEDQLVNTAVVEKTMLRPIESERLIKRLCELAEMAGLDTVMIRLNHANCDDNIDDLNYDVIDLPTRSEVERVCD